MSDPEGLTQGLRRGDQGVWFAPSSSQVSYGADAHLAYRQIEERSFWFPHRNRCIAAVMRSFPPAGRILDVGGGNGYVAHALAAAGFDCAVLEPGPDGARAARTRGVGLVLCARLEDLCDQAGPVAAAGLFDVLEHIEDDFGALRRLRGLLAPGARAYLTVPAYKFLFSNDDVADGHVRRYTASGLGAVLRRAGFILEFSTYLFSPLVAPLFALRTAPSRIGLRRGADRARQAAEHDPSGVAGRVLGWCLDLEARRIEAGGRIPFGTTCLAVARVRGTCLSGARGPKVIP